MANTENLSIDNPGFNSIHSPASDLLKIDSVMNDSGGKSAFEETPAALLLEQLIPYLEAGSPREVAHLQDDEPLTETALVIITIEHLLKTAQEQGTPLIRHDQSFLIFEGRFWAQIPEDLIRSYLGRVAEAIKIRRYQARHYRFTENLLKQFQTSAYLRIPQEKDDSVKINLKNGTFCIGHTERELKPHDPNDLIRYLLPFAFQPGATAPRFQQYLDRVLGDPCKQLILAEYLGYLFIKGSVLKLEKVLVLYGTGSNGKSVFFDVLMALLGNENVSNYSLQSLTDSTGYSRAALAGKLVNYASEISSKMDTTKFKLLASGEPIECRQIYGKPYILKDYCKFIFNCNALPKDVELNKAYFRRFLIIHFDQTIDPSEQEINLANTLIQNELPGIFNWILSGLTRLLNQGKFSSCPAVDLFIENFQKESDSVRLFLEELNYQPSSSEHLYLKDIFADYKEYCKINLYPLCSNRAFAERLRSTGLHVIRRKAGYIVYLKKDS